MDVEKLFNDLESNNSPEFDETKKKLAEFFNQTKEQWLVQGMMDYFLKTSSVRIIEVLVKVQPPHDKYVFDRLSEWIRSTNTGTRIPALTIFGFIVEKHPTWIYKIVKHGLIKDILKLLMTEKEIIPLMSALLCIIMLLPIIPSLVPPFLTELFDVFGHLASWNSQNPTKLTEHQLIHLQIGLYMLFHRLYGMFPINFIKYLRAEFIAKDKGAIFQHTIKPLLETVRMHPMLVTSTLENELNTVRWKEMAPHDVVVECSKLSLDYCQDNSECFAHALRTQESLSVETPVSVQLQNSQRNTPFRSNTGVTSPFYSLMHREKTSDLQKIDNIWSPSIEILATPPPTGTVPHTPTPTPVYGVPTVTSSVHDASGASPPEAAVEATPETTPMKDINLKRTIATNSPAVRAILGSSQPSSPMRKDQSPFYFPETSSHQQQYSGFAIEQTTTTTVTSQRLIQMVNDRNQSQHLLARSGSQECSTPIPTAAATATTFSSSSTFGTQFPLSLQDLQIPSGSSILKSGPFSSLDSPSTQEDQEVIDITSQHMGPHHSDTLQDISAECDDCDETERSPCSAGGLHVPTSMSMRMLAGRIKRERVVSYCVTDNNSYNTSPGDLLEGGSKVRRTKSWPAMERQLSLDENSLDIDPDPEAETQIEPEPEPEHDAIKQIITQQNGDSSSPSGDDAMSAATHFKKLQQKKARKIIQRPLQAFEMAVGGRISSGTQTLQQWPQIYEQNMLELFVELNKLRCEPEQKMFQPLKILDHYIERTIKMKQAGNREEALRDQIQLLQLHLNYERYRREIHAERNRRLLGKSRANRALEMDNERLKDQVARMHEDINALNSLLKKSSKNFAAKELELVKESNLWKAKYNSELEDNNKLRSTMDNLQRRLNEEIKIRKDLNTQLETTRGELFDMQNDMRQAQLQADLGCQYRQELAKLQCEMLVMGEIQIKSRDKLTELETMRARDEELLQLQKSYNEEIKELRSTLETKSAQLDTAKFRLVELQSQLASRDAMFTDQKRLLKSSKEEYQEKFNALNKKYETQKATILQMEEYILELNKNQTAVNSVSFSQESDKVDISGSADHNSPYSNSLASSEGLSASLRSCEFRNLQALVQPNTANTNSSVFILPPETAGPSESSASGGFGGVIGIGTALPSNSSTTASHNSPLGATTTASMSAGLSKSSISYGSQYQSVQQFSGSSISTVKGNTSTGQVVRSSSLSSASTSTSLSAAASSGTTTVSAVTAHSSDVYARSLASPINSLHINNSSSHSSSNLGRQPPAASLDIPVPGPSNQHHPHLQHHYPSHRK